MNFDCTSRLLFYKQSADNVLAENAFKVYNSVWDRKIKTNFFLTFSMTMVYVQSKHFYISQKLCNCGRIFDANLIFKY